MWSRMRSTPCQAHGGLAGRESVTMMTMIMRIPSGSGASVFPPLNPQSSEDTSQKLREAIPPIVSCTFSSLFPSLKSGVAVVSLHRSDNNFPFIFTLCIIGHGTMLKTAWLPGTLLESGALLPIRACSGVFDQTRTKRRRSPSLPRCASPPPSHPS